MSWNSFVPGPTQKGIKKNKISGSSFFLAERYKYTHPILLEITRVLQINVYMYNLQPYTTFVGGVGAAFT